MKRNANIAPNELEMSLYTFTHDYYLLQLPPPDHPTFYKTFPIYHDKRNFKGQLIKIAPIVRIYGTNQQNQKCCCHVHGYFPFLYIKAQEYEDALKSPTFLMQFLVKLQSLYQLAFQTDKAIIFTAELQYKYDFYGYHTQKQPFLKLYLYDPSYVYHMRQLLNSKIICNKSFQCYQAHINYYMQFFSDFNIYGINEMKICGFTFRKNLKIMQLFEKISSRLTEGIVHRGWNLQYLEQQRPQCFNCLYKMSCCYIEIDFEYHSILNGYEQGKDSQEEENSFSSSDEEMLAKSEGLRKIKVTVTKALQQIWRDEKKRRSRYNVRKTLEGVIDLSKNVECTPEVQEGNKDPLWINFMRKGDNSQEFVKMLKSYVVSKPLSQQSELTTNLQACSNYKQILSKQRQELVSKVHSRFQYYENRKNKILAEIRNGDRGQLPEWSDDQQFRSQNQSQQSVDSDHSQMLSQVDFGHKKNQNLPLDVQSMGNTLKYRNNFKFQLANFKGNSLFADCKLCRKLNYFCECILCESCEQQQCQCSKYRLLQEQTSRLAIGINSESMTVVQFQYGKLPPSEELVQQSRIVEHQKPFYSKLDDLYQHYKISPSIPMNRKTSQLIDKQLKNTAFFNRQAVTIPNSRKLPYFYQYIQHKSNGSIRSQTYELEYVKIPPSFEQVQSHLLKKKTTNQINRVSNNRYQDTFVTDLIVLTYELLIEIEEQNLYYGNPQKHPIFALVFELYNQKAPLHSIRAVIITKTYANKLKDFFLFDEVMVVATEGDLLALFISIVFRVDVDLFLSWDMEKRGLRYLLQRGIVNGINMAACLSRVNDLQEIFQHINFTQFTSLKETYLRRQFLIHGNVKDQARDKPTKDNRYYLNILNEKINKKLQKRPILRQKYKFDMQIKGRININLCRLCQQLKLISYSLEYVVQHIFQTQISEFTDKHLCMKAKEMPESALEYMIKRIEYQKLIVHELNIIGGIVEKSKVYGADFLSMMERGSQFKIESIMCRTAKQNGYLTLSATKAQVANQKLLECRPLVIQPPKQFYSQPVLLFDFQSLYPSVMIAYNLCYSTCLGSIKQLFKEGKRKRIGVNEQMSMHLDKICELIENKEPEDSQIEQLANSIFITPNRVAFARKNLKEGFIPKILLEFLISRIMIKKSSKYYHKDSIKKLLKERQIALKMFMNVLFGYTGATFSGRMPCSEIADSVVEVSKYCLRKSIDYLNNHPIYKGKVLYGDTDSIFFHLPNHKLSQTFEIGKILADEITKLFPYPMEMKFQKVYESLFLVSKKRYYGKSYESKDSSPKFQGKGIETVRRDGIPFTSIVMSKLLDNLIDSKDLSHMKQILLDESKRLLNGKVNIRELTLAKQVKMLKYSPKYLPAHAQAAKRLESIDSMMLPKYGERLKYVIVQGIGPIKNRAIPLFEFMLKKDKYKLDLDYYYSNLFLPPLRRTLISLVNLDQWGTVNQYNRSTPRPIQTQNSHHLHRPKKGQALCEECLEDELTLIRSTCDSHERICSQCVGEKGLSFEECVQLNCPNLFQRRKKRDQWNTARQKAEEIKMILKIIGT